MNWMMSKKMMMNTESMTTLPPLVQTMMIRGYCQFINGINTVATQAQKNRKGLAQIPSRRLTDTKERNPFQTSGALMENVLSCRRDPNHTKALHLDLLAKLRCSLFQWIMPDGGLQGVGVLLLLLHLLKVSRGRRATMIARRHSITKQLSI
jgi:hypothetical protein